MAIADEFRPQHSKIVEKKKKKSFSDAFIPNKYDTQKELISKIISLFSMLVLVVCIIILSVYFYQQLEAKQNNKNIKVIYNQALENTPTVITEKDNSTATDNSAEDTEKKPLVVSDAAEKMLAINTDYAGYISIPNVVDEAVVQGTDDEYYLTHNFYDQKRSCGTIFADFRSVVNDYEQSDVITLYGHNQRDGTMFGQLDYYTWDYRYWLKNPFIYFDTKYENNTYVIVSSFITNTKPEHDNGNVFRYNDFTDFQPSGEFTAENFLKEITERSQFITGLDYNADDKYLILSTCAYDWEPSRHVIVARKLRADETTANIDTTKFQVNPNPKWPAIYYKYNGGSYTPSTSAVS